MNSDHFFAIGSTHKVCQDYAISGNYKGFYYAIVSDGCSSSPDSDFGSRILAKICEKNIKDLVDWRSKDILSIRDYVYNDNQKIFEYIIKYSKIRDNLDLNPLSFDATLLYTISDGKNIIINIWGDGAFLIKYKNGYIKFVNIKYSSGYPFYLNYYFDQNRFNKFLEQSKERQINSYFEYPDIKGPITTVFDTIHNSIDKNNCESIFYPYQNYIGVLESKDIESISIMSDGISSFYQTNTNDTSIVAKELNNIDMVKKMLFFKNFNGQFVQRRMQAFQKDCKKNNIEHQDDLAVATICF